MANIVPDQDRLNDEQYGDSTTPSGGAEAYPETLAEALLPNGQILTIKHARRVDVPAMLSVMHAAFAARPALGAPPAALAETVSSLTDALTSGSGFVAFVADEPAATVLVSRHESVPRVSRVAVHPQFQRLGLAAFMVEVVLEALAESGEASVSLLCRREFPQIESWWIRRGFARVGAEDDCWVLQRALPVIVEVADADAMRDLGRRLAALVRPGDLIIAAGDLGAGKTTFTQGLAEGMGVSGAVISPTFVLSRVHRSPSGGPALVHVDAYRLAGAAELEDLDLEESLADSVTLVEWGSNVAESLNPNRLEIEIRRSDARDDETRWVYVTPVGVRWDRAALLDVLGKEYR